MGKVKRNKRPYSGNVGALRNILAGAAMPPQQRQEAYRLLGMLSKELGDAQEALEVARGTARLKNAYIEGLKADNQFYRGIVDTLSQSLNDSTYIITKLWTC